MLTSRTILKARSSIGDAGPVTARAAASDDVPPKQLPVPVVIVGLRGLPGVPGGIEAHCEQVYRRLAASGERLLVLTRSPYRREWPVETEWKGIGLRKLWAPRIVGVEALVHTLWGVIYARCRGARIVHIHGIGPGLMVPLARAMGLSVVFTHHGFDYRRQKWGPLARAVLRVGELLGVWAAHHTLCVSREVVDKLSGRFGSRLHYAPNGVEVIAPAGPEDLAAVRALDLEPDGYAVIVARLVPEKGWETAFAALDDAPAVTCLVGVGGSSESNAYERKLRRSLPARVRLLGAQPHPMTLSLVRCARVFVLPSSHEGLPIALLEAMAAGRVVVASDITPHREVIRDGENGLLFKTGDSAHLGEVLQHAWTLPPAQRERLGAAARRTVAEEFSWKTTVAAVRSAYADLRGG